MLWIVLVIIAGLAGLAYGWIEVRKSDERVTISLELAKVTPAIGRAKAAALAVIQGAKGHRAQHGQHSSSGGPS